MAAGTFGASYKLLVALGVASGLSAAAIIVSFAASIEAVFWSHIEVAARGAQREQSAGEREGTPQALLVSVDHVFGSFGFR